MMLTLSWKELREHRSIWLAMVVMTGVLAFALERLSEQFDAPGRVGLTVLVMATAYGVVCGAMMLAGEREAGTLVFLDTFSGKRGRMWSLKLLIGVLLAATEALAVALVLRLLTLYPPDWLTALLGRENRQFLGPGATTTMEIWLLVLPAITLEAFAWGMLGSALTSRVLSAAAMAAGIAALLWLIGLCGGNAPVFLVLRLLAAGAAVFASCAIFLTQTRDHAITSAPPRPDERRQRVRRAAEHWEGDKFEMERRAPRLSRRGEPVLTAPTSAPARDVPMPQRLTRPPVRRGRRPEQAYSPGHVLWWLTLWQAGLVLAIMGSACVVIGLLLPRNAEWLWPLATLLIGVGCGVAAFAPEQRDLSYQFLAAQHLPLKTFWNVKIGFWLLTAAAMAGLMALAGLLSLYARRDDPFQPAAGFESGVLQERMGPVLFLGAWLAYGFAAGAIFVLFCQKNMLAILLAGLAGAATIVLWLPALLCGGTNGWQVWLPPIIVLVATRFLMRAWAGGRIKDRKPLLASLGLGGLILVWCGLNAAARTLEIPDVGEPLDRAAFKASIPRDAANQGARSVNEAVSAIKTGGKGGEEKALARLADAARLPVGVMELPSRDGPPPALRHLPDCAKLTRRLRELAQAAQAEGARAAAFEHLNGILVLSRNLRSKASMASYLAGIEIEESAITGLNGWLAREKPERDVLSRVLHELNRHADQTPPPLDCLHTECYRSGGLVEDAAGWTFYGPRVPGLTPKRWLANGIVVSLDTPWEDERKLRLWAAVWAGLFRGIETPHWELPATAVEPSSRKETTRRILHGWLPAADGGGAAITSAQLARWLDDSWLSDERLFTPTFPLRNAATRARWRVDSTRLAVALALFQLTEGKPASKLEALVPKYVSDLPVDPYSGQGFRYRISDGERLEFIAEEGPQLGQPAQKEISPGQGIVWSTGPDRTDHGGRKQGTHLPDDDPRWSRADFDLLTIVPFWP